MDIAELCEILDNIDPDAGGYDDYLRTRVLNVFPVLASAYIEMTEVLDGLLGASPEQYHKEAYAALRKARGEA